MHVEFLHLVAGGTQVLAGVELAGLLVEDLAHGGGHGETAVAVDVDLADGALGGFAELFLGDTHGVDPDILLDNDPLKEFAGQDQQLEKAVEVALSQLSGRKPLPKTPAPRTFKDLGLPETF